MGKRLLALAAGMALVGSGTATAAPFNSFDPRSMAMGGAGVAASNPATAPFFNPAGLAVAGQQEDFAVELPIVGARVSDPKDFLKGLTDFQDADIAGRIAGAHTPAQYQALANQLLNDNKSGLPAVTGKPIQGDGGIATVLTIPSHTYGIAVVADSTVAFGGEGFISAADRAALTQLINECGSPNPADQAQCLTDASNFNPTSSFRLRGLWLTEVGVSLAREFAVRGIPGPVALGITPKYLKATTVDYTADVNNANTADISSSHYTSEQGGFNFDLGMAKDFRNGWRGGLVVKNVIPQEYKYKQFGVETGTVTLNPQVRAGVGYQNSWFTALMDVDLTENDPVGIADDKSRFIALGTEFNALDWAQLRLGYRINTSNDDRNVASVGVGLSPFGVHLDLAVAGNSTELGLAAQLGVRF